jgi:hypothetical protein
MSYINALLQNVLASASNNSAANLNAAAVFAGVAELTTGVAGIQVNFKADQNATIYVDQSNGVAAGTGTVTTNGTTTLTGSGTKFLRDFNVGDQIFVTGETVRVVTNVGNDTTLTVSAPFSTSAAGLAFTQYHWDVIDAYTYYYSKGGVGFTVQATSLYFRVRVINNGASATTYLRLTVALCPVVEAMPRSLDSNYNQKTAIQSMKDGYGFAAENTPMGELRTAIPTRLVGTPFEAFLTAGTGTVTTNGTTTLAGSSTLFTTELHVGDPIYVTGETVRYVVAIASPTSLTVNAAFATSTGGLAYNYYPWPDPRFWVGAVDTGTGGGYIRQQGAQVTLGNSFGTPTANGTSKLYSLRRARYVSGTGMRYRAVVQFSAGATNNQRRFGIAFGTTMPTITDGAYFQLNGTTFSVVTLKAGVPSAVDSGSFNGDLGAVYAPGTNVATFEIYWTNSKVYFSVGGVLLHTVSAAATTWSDTMSHYIWASNVNSGAISTDQTLTIRVASITRLGQLLTQPQYVYQSGTTTGLLIKRGPGNLHCVVVSNVPTSGAIVTLYDGTSTGGAVISAFTFIFPGGGNFNPVSIDFKGIPFANGLFLVIATQNANVMLAYE